jgi:hypothetical protein
MVFKLPTMTRETSSSTGAGDMVLAGAQAHYFALSAGLSNGDTTFLTFTMGSDFEEGKYTYNSGANSVTRTQIYRSTNANAAVIWAPGTKDVICGLPGPSNVTAADLDLFVSLLNVNHSSCGRLTYVSSTQLKFAPYNGDKIKIGGVWYSIPSGGITAANTSIFLNGSANNLIGTTTYLVCLFNNAGTLTFDFLSTLTHAPDTSAGNVGVEIPTGDSSRTVIGLIRTLPTTATFADSATQRFVISWLNRRTKSVQNSFTVPRTTTSASLVEVNTEIRCEFLTWGDEDVVGRLTGNANNDTATGVHSTDAVFDGSGAIDGCRVDQPNAGQDAAIAATKRASLSEGYHYLTLFGRRGATVSTITYPAAVQLEAEIRG